MIRWSDDSPTAAYGEIGTPIRTDVDIIISPLLCSSTKQETETMETQTQEPSVRAQIVQKVIIEEHIIEKLRQLPRGRSKIVPLVLQATNASQELIEATLDAMVQRCAFVEKPKGKGTQFHIPDHADGGKPAEGAAQPEEQPSPVAEVLAKKLPTETPPSVMAIFEAARAVTDSRQFWRTRKERASDIKAKIDALKEELKEVKEDVETAEMGLSSAIWNLEKLLGPKPIEKKPPLPADAPTILKADPVDQLLPLDVPQEQVAATPEPDTLQGVPKTAEEALGETQPVEAAGVAVT